MTSIRISGEAKKLGSARLSDEFSGWTEEWLRDGAFSPVMETLGRNALVLDSLEYGEFPAAEARASFIPNDMLGLGREDSKHEVKFGQLMLNGRDVHEQPDMVALKPFDEIDGLKREWAVSQYLNEIFDEQHALLPLGVHRSKDGLSLISAYEHGIKSLDNVLWADPVLEPEALRPPVVRRTVALGVLALGMMHGGRVVHRDAQAKNIAMDRNIPRFIDLEDAEIIEEDAIDSDEAFNKTRNDISAFIGSITQVEESKDIIIPALAATRVVDEVVKQYQRGVKFGRASQNGGYIPRFEKANEEYIRSQLNDLK